MYLKNKHKKTLHFFAFLIYLFTFVIILSYPDNRDRGGIKTYFIKAFTFDDKFNLSKPLLNNGHK